MKTISIFRKTDLGKETISLKLCIVGEAWLNNSLFLIVDPHIHIDELKYARDRAMVFQENNYYTVFGKIDVNGRNCLVVKPKKTLETTLENTVLNPQELLSERELQIVELVALGKSNKQIGKKLKISEWTVSTHLRRVFVKLKVDSRAAMVYHCASLVRSRIKTTQQKKIFAHLLPPK